MSLENPRSGGDVEAILAENARLLGEPQTVFLRPLADGGFRLQVRVNGQWRRGRSNRKDYSSLTQLCRAARIALANARAKANVA